MSSHGDTYDESKTDWTATDVFKKPLFILQEESASSSSLDTNCPTSRNFKSDSKTADGQNVISSTGCNTFDSSYQPTSRKKLLPKSNYNTLDFSEACISEQDSITHNKKHCRNVLKEKNSCQVNFEIDESQNCTIPGQGIQCLHKPSNKDVQSPGAEFSVAFTTQKSFLLKQAPRDQFRRIDKEARFTNAFMSSENTLVEDLQYLEFKPNEASNGSKKSAEILEKRNPDKSICLKSTSKTIDNVEDSLIDELFKKSMTFVVPPPRMKKSKHRLKTSIDLLPKKPNFPRFDDYMNDLFYKYLIEKMEPKYGLKTNNEAVRVAKFTHEIVSQIMSMDVDYHDKVKELEYLLARKQVIRTHFDFWRFCVDYLPSEFYLKSIPMMKTLMQPVWSATESSD